MTIHHLGGKILAATKERSEHKNVERPMSNVIETMQPPPPAQSILQPKASQQSLSNGQGFSVPGPTDSALPRLIPLEGLRAYLALWVLFCHACWAGGYLSFDASSNVRHLVLSGALAVDIFIIISGFVIFFLLDKQRETYMQFIVRRFFRLFPVFFALFTVAIPLSQLAIWNVTQASQYLPPNEIERLTGTMGSWWENIQWHLPLHVLMLHGLVPEVLLKEAPQAFLMPAWSISLEWQFYLVAPLAYALAASSRPLPRIGLCAACISLLWAARYVLPDVMYGAALPFHVEFFFIGAASYFAYNRYATHGLSDVSFPIACSLAVFLFVLSDHSLLLIPIELWLVFMGLILEHPSSLSSRLTSPLFANPFVQFLGRISYSIYLSHILVIIVMQYALLTWAPQLSQMVHTGLLLICTMAATVVVSAGLYHFLEAPGIQVGRALALRLAPRQAIDSHNEMTRSRRSPDHTLIQDYK